MPAGKEARQTAQKAFQKAEGKRERRGGGLVRPEEV
jgi:hypothetical protein